VLDKDKSDTAIDADILAYYAKVEKAFAPLPADATAQDMRARFRRVAAEFSTPRPEGIRSEDIVIPLDGRELAARVYRPDMAGSTEPLPLIVYFHGGGWVVGDLDTHDTLVARLAHDAQCAVASVDYRMAPEAPFPAPADDALDALIWLAEHRARLGFAINRLGVAGDSAGAHLTAVAARGANDRVGGLVSAQLLLYPVVRYVFEGGSHTANADGPGLTIDEMRWYWDQFLDAKVLPVDDIRAFPLAQPFKRPPAPALIVAAGHDLLYDDAFEFAKFVDANGGHAEVIDAADMTHGFGRFQAQSKAAESWMKMAGERFGEMIRA
jgi:acetyl esterase